VKKEDIIKVIALTLAESRTPIGGIPLAADWALAKTLAFKFETAGHIKPEPKKQDDEELIVYGYCVVDRDGKFIKEFGQNQQGAAIDFATESTEACIDAGIDWDYRVAAIVDQGGL